MSHALHLIRVFATTLAVSFALGCTSTIIGQSGRQVRKSAPAPVATPEPTPTLSKSVEKEKPTITFLVGVDQHNGFSTIPLQYYDSVVRACSERLDDASAVKSDTVHREINRRDAISLAKTQKTAYVVWLQFKLEGVNPDPTMMDNVNLLYLEYSVFEPTTAKVVTWGHTYQGARNKGPVVRPSPSGRGNTAYSEYLLKQAARNAAEKILDAMKVMGRELPKGVTSTSVPLLRTTDQSRHGISRRLHGALLSLLGSARHLQLLTPFQASQFSLRAHIGQAL